MKTKLTGAVVLPDEVVEDGAVVYEDSKILYAGRRQTAPDAGQTDDYTGCYLAPGFIDLHLHGGAGCDFMDGTVEAFLEIARFHARHGTTAMLPTTLACSDEELFRFLDTYREAKGQNTQGAGFVGVHLEGPYFAQSQRGAQDERYLLPIRRAHYEKILAYSNDIARWTVASELEGGLAFGRILRERGILASLGHSGAMYDDALAALQNGYTLLTHFYSCMNGLQRVNSYRVPGLIEAGYMLDFSVELIADGCHLPISLLEYIPRAKGVGKVTLCTDASRGAGLPEGAHILLGSEENGQDAIIEEGVAKLADGRGFAGSVATTDRLVRNMHLRAGYSLPDAVQMMSLNPARLIGLGERKGSLQAGKDADIVVLTPEITLRRTIVGGNTVYESTLE